MPNTATAQSSPQTAEQVLGAICWNELHTRDTQRAADFYTKVVGWSAASGPAGESHAYTEWVVQSGAHVGGMMQMPAGVPAEVPASWALYINVDDVDAAVARAVALGGRGCMAPVDVPQVGRLCQIADPTGAMVYLFKGVGKCGTRAAQSGPGSFCWFELLTHDPAAAERFYTQLLGWSVTRMPMSSGEYTLFWLPGADTSKKTGGVGGMMKITPDMGSMPSNWLTYIQVEDVDAGAARAAQHGGKICVPPCDIPNVGRFAVATDPTGAAFALFTAK